MMSIENDIQNEFIINKSRFITYLYKINKKEEIDFYLKKIKAEYKDATHHCYAYILDNNKKCSDDGEPSKTAGAPILHVLESNELNHILCIVVRFYGGIKLGAGGLVRAYTKSITECLKLTNIILLEKGYIVEITFEHNNIKQIDYILKKYDLIKKYDHNIIYQFKINELDYESVKNNLLPYVNNFKIIETTFI